MNFKFFGKRHQIVETSIKNLSYSMILSVNSNSFYGRIYHDVPGTYIVRQTEKNSKKHPAFKDKSGDIKKVVIVRRRLI